MSATSKGRIIPVKRRRITSAKAGIFSDPYPSGQFFTGSGRLYILFTEKTLTVEKKFL